MDRRTFLVTLPLAVLTAPLAAPAQQAGKIYRIGWVGGASAALLGHQVRAFVQELRSLGYMEGQNIAIEYRWAEGRLERLPDLVADLVRLKVDVIVSSSSPAILAAKQVTSTIPIVMAGVTDPLGAGFVASLARPGGNITGLSTQATELSAKRLELLKEVAPGITRVASLWNPTHPGQPLAFRETQDAAQALGVTLLSMEVRKREEVDSAFAAVLKERANALIVLPDPLMMAHRKQIADFTAKNQLPSMYGAREWVDAGGLIAYGASFRDLARRAATYVDKILKGAKPGDLPVEQPSKFELVINLKTAKGLGLAIPQTLLLRADQVIQ